MSATASAQVIPPQISLEDDGDLIEKDDAVEIGHELAPEQIATVQRSVITLKEYDFLPSEIKLLVDAAPGCGGVQWPAAEILARYLTHLHQQGSLERDNWSNKQIVELGAGTGVLSMALATLLPQAQNIVATDMDQLLPLLRANIELNGMSRQIRPAVLNWGEPIDPHLKPDIVLAADCVYLECTFPLLVDTLKNLCGPDTLVLLSYKKRRKADKRFFNQLRKWFTWEEVADPAKESYRRESLYMYAMRRKPSSSPSPQS